MLSNLYKNKILSSNTLKKLLEEDEQLQNKNHAINALIRHQKKHLSLINDAYEQLNRIKSKTIEIDGIDFEVDFNQLRKQNTIAEINKKTIESQNCFLCPEYLYPEQMGIKMMDFIAFLNPRPIYINHLTLVKEHKPQHIKKSIVSSMVKLTKDIYPYRLLYNSPGSGATMSTHMHLQAIPYKAPIENEFIKRENVVKLKNNNIHVLKFPSRVLVVEGENKDVVKDISEILNEIKNLRYLDEEWGRHIVSIWGRYLPEKDIHQFFVIPRSKWRSHDYGLEEDKIACSPGTLEMCGKIIVANKSTFDKMDEKLIRRILDEVSMRKGNFEELIKRLFS
ncbi:MAG: DUF4922 domain-containing protein [Candidatus Aenigmarchaeota archaeon]|nr:DUF4922 domain-containing protein [Candidatus Aenigmarchaeota archaeon]